MCLNKRLCFLLPGAVPLTAAVAALALLLQPAPASAQTCLQDEYNKVQKQKLNCTANDVRIAKVTNIRDPVTGQALTTCLAGSTFNFLADFEVLTTSSQARENIGLYIATNSTTQALTGSCVDNIITPTNSDNYHETDASPDTCGDTSSHDLSPTFGAGAEKVTLEIDNFSCTAPAGSNTLVLPNCTSWQIPGGTIQCVSTNGLYPFNGPNGTPTAIPGSPAKCNCDVISLPITVVTPGVTVAKSCNTALSTGTGLTSCNAGAEGNTVTYTVGITNTSNTGGITVDQICDSAYGNVFTASGFTPACTAGTVGSITGTTCTALDIAQGATKTCTFTAVQGELATVTDTLTASGHSDISLTQKFGPTSSNSVTVTSADAPSTATTTKGVDSTTAACATVRYNVDVKNTSGADESLTLSALNDTAFGDITQVQGSVLGTTCGVATGSPGLGTLSATTGAGRLPLSVPVDLGNVSNHYTCKFDAQFCGALDNNSCISHTNKANATLAGDEQETVTVTANTLTVKQCLTTTVTSQ